MEKILTWEMSQYLDIALNYFIQNASSISYIFLFILFSVYFYLYLKEFEKRQELEMENEVLLQMIKRQEKQFDEEIEKVKKWFEFDKEKLQKLCDDLWKNIKDYLWQIEEIRTHYINDRNRLTTQIAYYKKKFLVLHLANKELFWENKAVARLIKQESKEFRKMSIKELTKKLENKQKQI